jgi:hypothetical protein
VVLARLLTLLRSPAAPVLPDDALMFRIDALPALAMVRMHRALHLNDGPRLPDKPSTALSPQ